MHTITFTCETITPMFLSGADGTTPELRAPSIKGALRFWWRAMNGKLPQKENGTFDYLPLKSSEQSIFGGTGGFKSNNKKQEAARSDFNIRISNASEYAYQSKNDFKDKPGLRYFYYLIVPGEKGQSPMNENDKALKPGNTFDVIFSANEKEALLDACASFWLLTYFGGLGSRARRGGGSFRITGVTDKDNILQDKLQMLPTNNPKDFLEQGLKEVVQIVQKKQDDTICSEYSTLQSNRVYVSKNGENSWKEALDKIASMMKNIRTDTKRPPDRTQTQATLHQKAAFGLPISVRGEKKNVVEFSKKDKDKDDFNHHSSPIMISIVQFGTKFYWTLVYLQGDFMPPDTKIVFNPTTGLPKQKWNDVDNTLLKSFITTISNTSTSIKF